MPIHVTNTIFWLLIATILLLLVVSSSSATIVSKCHHEGDFTVACNKTKLPSSPDLYEVMRYAKLINGLFYNDSLCTYVPNTGCARKSTLTHCVDQPTCTVKNSWFSLEPHCSGNSYYSQLEYDCQPVFNMCGEREAAFNSVIFSGLVLSPYYPHSYKTEQTRTCYLTINLPKNHHAEITLDFFDITKTSKCMGDYLEVQEYKEVPHLNGDDEFVGGKSVAKSLSRIFIDPHKNKDAISSTIINNDVPTSTEHQDLPRRRVSIKNKQQKAKNKSSRQQKKSKYKWQTLRTMCGRINGSLTFRASADIISFKFRSLGTNYQHQSNPNINNHRNGPTNQGFKIFFQGNYFCNSHFNFKPSSLF